MFRRPVGEFGQNSIPIGLSPNGPYGNKALASLKSYRLCRSIAQPGHVGHQSPSTRWEKCIYILLVYLVYLDMSAQEIITSIRSSVVAKGTFFLGTNLTLYRVILPVRGVTG